MRLVCLHADTIDALKRLNIRLDDLTPGGLWSSQYHLVGLTADQVEALETFQIEAEDVTPAQLIQAGATSTAERRPVHGVQPGQSQIATAGAAAVAGTPPGGPDQTGREQSRAAGGAESEVPLTQVRDGGARPAEAKGETKPDAKPVATAQPQPSPTPPSGGQAALKNGGKGAQVVAPPAQGGRKGQPQQSPPAQAGGQRYGTTRLRISVAGKYTEATVANGKIVVAGRTFDSPDQAAAELTKSRGDWTFWEYYDSTDGKWRMLTRDWDTVLKSAAQGGR